jgi:hypothetical protein
MSSDMSSDMSSAPLSNFACGGPSDCASTPCCHSISPVGETTFCFDPAVDCAPGDTSCACDKQGLDFTWRVVCKADIDCAGAKKCCPTATQESDQPIGLCMDSCPN